ncbi:MarC family protein [Actinomyces sp. MRS3W]|uniref:MarC family protein n=1 Tax=Actinomyces sp. MRS3W TaxID=2800796 RepID=UPI0028FD554B|nr:MarC family protein [Actinomyces sp. MRS3W]MDU0347632.1 MarC family protein [Actinomyces sp. MRS3W]
MLDTVFNPTLFATAFTTILVIQDPLGAIPIFLSLTSRQTHAERTRSARQATLVSFAVILAFAIFGRYILRFLGITVPALQISGGLLLLLVALELLTDKTDEHPDPDAVVTNAALVPLGTPLLAGPGAIVAAMVAVDSASDPVVGWVSVTAAIVATHVVIWVALRFSASLHRILGESVIQVLTRIFGLLLAAIAVQMMADGVLAYVDTIMGA